VLQWGGQELSQISAMHEAKQIEQHLAAKIKEWQDMGHVVRVALSSHSVCNKLLLLEKGCREDVKPHLSVQAFANRFKLLQARLKKIQNWEKAEGEREKTKVKSASHANQHGSDKQSDSWRAQLSRARTSKDHVRVVLIGIDNHSKKDKDYVRELNMFIAQRKAIIPVIFPGEHLPTTLNLLYEAFTKSHRSIRGLMV
jgi:hypothetical protein